MDYNKEFRKYATKHLNLNPLTVDGVIEHQVSSSMTPYILEERSLNVTQMDVFSRLMRDRILFLEGVVDDRMSSVSIAQLLFLDSAEKKDITLYIDSPGGSVKSGLSIVDVMNYIKSDVATINTGMCASMGSVLLSSGTKGKRYSLIQSRVMTHMVSHGTHGNVQDTRISQLQAEKYNYVLFKILAQNCGKTFKEMLESSRRDNWMNSDESLAFGIVDEIIGIDTRDSITKLLEGFDEYYETEVIPNLR
jgi:ATP-dependent Clp protease protease subunit